jgi:hypothetical protein
MTKTIAKSQQLQLNPSLISKRSVLNRSRIGSGNEILMITERSIAQEASA